MTWHTGVHLPAPSSLSFDENLSNGCDLSVIYLCLQVMETKNMLYLVSEYAPNGEIFGKSFFMPCLYIVTHYVICGLYFNTVTPV